MKKFKVIVIGGGTAGLKTAIASSKKTKTLLIEPGIIGGTCLNTGCIPTKAMLYASHLYALTKEMSYFGVKAKAEINFRRLMHRVASISKEGRDHIYNGLKNNKNLVVVKAKAKFIGNKKIQAGNEAYTADNIVIATGAKNFIPPIKGLKETGYFDNESFLKAKIVPKSIIMIGGGYISMEYASFFKLLGVKVTVLERLPEILGIIDDDVRKVLLESHEKEGIKIITNANILEIKKGVEVSYNDVRNTKSKINKIRTETVFLATGRVPNTDLDLEKSGIKTGKKGEIIVDDYLETSCTGVYAIGDCNGYPMFAHSAKRQTYVVMDNMFENRRRMEFSLVPWATFSEPVVAGIGLNEREAKEKNIDYGVMKAGFNRNGRAKIIEKQLGFAKVIYNKKTRKIIGSTIIGANADDIIHEIVALIYADSTIDVLKEMIHIHPTFSEVMENLK
ncbi:MAG: dihydrolipoyl dehydrogenase [Nanoarchaeota archaeon]